VILCLLLLALPVATQEEEGTIALVALYKVKAGMQKEFEEGRKRHVEFHKQANDTDTWIAWQVVSGENTGAYGVGSFGHKWEDFDTPTVDDAADEADRAKNIAPYIDSVTVHYWARLSKVSRPAEAPAKMSVIILFDVHYSKAEEFNYLIGKFHKAIEKTKWPAHYDWYALVNGGEQPTYALVLPRENWAAFKPLEKPFDKMLEEAYGRQEASALLDKWGKVIKGSRSHINLSRPDLSYIPKKGGM